MDGLFKIVAEQEKQIRQNPAAQDFGSAEVGVWGDWEVRVAGSDGRCVRVEFPEEQDSPGKMPACIAGPTRKIRCDSPFPTCAKDRPADRRP